MRCIAEQVEDNPRVVILIPILHSRHKSNITTDITETSNSVRIINESSLICCTGITRASLISSSSTSPQTDLSTTKMGTRLCCWTKSQVPHFQAQDSHPRHTPSIAIPSPTPKNAPHATRPPNPKPDLHSPNPQSLPYRLVYTLINSISIL